MVKTQNKGGGKFDKAIKAGTKGLEKGKQIREMFFGPSKEEGKGDDKKMIKGIYLKMGVRQAPQIIQVYQATKK